MEASKQSAGRLEKADTVFRTVIRAICGVSVFSIFLLIIIQVFFRYVLRQSLGGAEELPTYIMAVACWLSVPVAALEDSHINIDLIPNMFHGRARIGWSMWGEAVEFVTMSIFAGMAWKYCAHMISTNNKTGGLGIPMWIFYVFIVIGAALCAFFGLVNFIQNARRIAKWKQD